MSLKQQISEDVKAAMRARDAARLSALRLLAAAINHMDVDERVELGDAEVLAVIEKMMKQRRESIAQYEKAGRGDLVANESFEMGVLSAYLPQQMSDDEVAQAVAAALAESGAAGVRDMGKVMALLKPRLAGKADMAKVSLLVKTKLSG
ncbi:MAG: GatB/YqeY domain-containing protein [Betaproteobacteria bacterium]